MNYLRYTERKRVSDKSFLGGSRLVYYYFPEQGLKRKNCSKLYREHDKTHEENKQYPLKVLKKKSKGRTIWYPKSYNSVDSK